MNIIQATLAAALATTPTSDFDIIVDRDRGEYCPEIVTEAEVMCCDLKDSRGRYTNTPCRVKSSGCSRGWTTETVCHVNGACYDDPALCDSESVGQDCFWVEIMGDGGYWYVDFVCLDILIPIGCGGGGDPAEDECDPDEGN
jgi:hypothetical protein